MVSVLLCHSAVAYKALQTSSIENISLTEAKLILKIPNDQPQLPKTISLFYIPIEEKLKSLFKLNDKFIF